MKRIKILGIIFSIIALTYFGYIKVSRFFAIDSCLDRGGSWNYAKNECELAEQKDSSMLGFKVYNALTFINEYTEISNKMNLGNRAVEWVYSNNLVTQNFKAELKILIDDAHERDTELGLDADPIFDAQDNPSKGFVLVSFDEETNYLTVRGKDWPEYKLTMKIVEENGNWLVDGCGIINIPLTKRAKR